MVSIQLNDGPQIPTFFDIFSKEFLPTNGKDGDTPFSRGSNQNKSNSGPNKLKPASATRDKGDRGDKKSFAGMPIANWTAPRGKRTLSEDSGTDISPHSTISGTDSQRMRAHQRGPSKLSTLFSPFVKVDKQEQLAELLSSYSSNGLPTMPELLTIGTPQHESAQFELEYHWTSVVNNAESLSKKQKDHQEAVWELLRTEVNYIKTVKVVLDLFMCCLINLQNESLLNEIETEKLFSNVSDIYSANSSLWCDYMLPVVTHSRETKQRLNPVLMKDGFSKFEEVFQPYTKYCLDQEMCLEYIKSKYRDNELFRSFVGWAEAQKACGRLRLTDLVVKPWQRLTKYTLLLNAIKKNAETDQEKEELKLMIDKADKFVRHVNTTMRQRHEQERLGVIMKRIESFDTIDAPNEESVKIIQEFAAMDLTCPVPGCRPSQKRHLLLEGPIKLRDAYSKMEVYCFLLTDMFLVTKSLKRGDKLKVIKPPMRLDKIVIQDLRDPAAFLLVYLNEFHIASAAYVFQGEAKHWSRHIRKAQEAYKEARNAAYERPEHHHVLYTGLYDETEDDLPSIGLYGPPPPYPHGDVSIDGYGRGDSYDSSSSVDRYFPNKSHITRSASNDTLIKMVLAEQRASASGTEDEDSSNRPRSRTFGESDIRRPISPEKCKTSSSMNEKIYNHVPLNSPQSSSSQMNSPIDSPGGGVKRRTGAGLKPPVPPKPTSKHGTPEQVNFAFNTPQNPTELAAFFGDEYIRGKLNQRRTSRTEKRYYTADAIQELQKDKDNSIHKRLSWNYGTAVDISIDERAHLKNRVFSSDSIRSVPSSSGVSSTGSLHHPEDSISEHHQMDMHFMNNDKAFDNVYHNEPGLLSPHNIHLLSPHDSVGSVTHSHSDNNMAPPRTPSSTNSDNYEKDSDDSTLTSGSKSTSKSLPDISQLHLSTGEIQDGIASVHIAKPEGQRRKLTHAQILRMKKQLLLNSTLEASEV